MAVENKEPVQLEFKSSDDAWYSVSLELKNARLTVHYLEFAEEEDDELSVGQFKSVQDLRSKFRFSSKQLQDHCCGKVKKGMSICASYSKDEETKFFDAVVQRVCRFKHRKEDEEEECKCTFEVLWKDGPCASKSTFVSCENICLLTPGSIESHPIIKAFVKLVEEKVEQSLHRNTLKKKAAKDNVVADSEVLLQDLVFSSEAMGSQNCISGFSQDKNSKKILKTTVEAPLCTSIKGTNETPNSGAFLGKQEETHLDSVRKEEKLSLDLNSKVELEQEQLDIPTTRDGFHSNANNTNRKDGGLDLNSKVELEQEKLDIPSHSEAFLIKREETHLDSVRKEEKLSLDLNSKVELEQEQFDIPTTTVGFHSNANNTNRKDDGFLGISKNVGSPENQSHFHSGWLEAEDCGILQIGKGGFNAINNEIAGNSACLTADIRNKGRRLFDDHAVSACRGIKRPSLSMFMDNLDEGYNLENVGEQVTVAENTNDKKIMEKKKVLASSWGKGKRQKHISNESFAGERKVQDHNQTGENVNASKKLIQDGNDFDRVDLLSSSCLTPHVKNSTNLVTTETLVFSTGMKDLVDQNLANGETRKFAHDHKESVVQIISDEVLPQETPFEVVEMTSEIKSHIPHLQSNVKVNIRNVPSDSFKDSSDHADQNVNNVHAVKGVTKHAKLNRKEKSSPGFLSVEENDHGIFREKSNNEILDLSRQLDNHVQLQEGLSTSEKINEGCTYKRVCLKNGQTRNEYNPIYRGKSEGQKNLPPIQHHNNSHCDLQKSNCCSSDYSDATDMPSFDSEQDLERCKSHPSECRCRDLDICNANASSEDESFDGEVTSCNCCGKHLKSTVLNNRTNTRICRDSQEARCGCNGAGLGHCSEDLRAEDKQINYSEVLVLDNLEKDVRPSDVKMVIASVTCVVQVYILPSPKFEQFTRGFVWFRDHASLMKALAFLQNDDFFIISSNGRPWVALLLHIDNDVCKGIFGGYAIESKDSKHSCVKTLPSTKISFVHRGTDEYERAKIRKNMFLEFKEHLAILHKRLGLEECSGY